MLPSGTRWCELRAGGSEYEDAVEEGQTVRIDYACRLDDGTRLAGGTASFRLGKKSGAVCHALDEVVLGMRLGDMRTSSGAPGGLYRASCLTKRSDW